MFLAVVEVFLSADHDAVVGVVLDVAAHEGGRGVVGADGEVGGDEGGEAAPEIKGVGEFVVPDFFGEEDLGFERRFGGTGVAPAV